MRLSPVSAGVKVPCTSVEVVTLHGLLRNSTLIAPDDKGMF
jgi:hypothetical protein